MLRSASWGMEEAMIVNSAAREWRHALSWLCTRLTPGLVSDKLFTEVVSGYRNALPLWSEEDVLGAGFIYVKLEKHCVDQLRRWLACRGIKKSWNKTALLERKALWRDQHCSVRTHAWRWQWHCQIDANTFVTTRYPIIVGLLAFD